MIFRCVYCDIELFGENKFSCESCKLERYNTHTQRYTTTTTQSKYVRFDYTRQEKKPAEQTVPVAAQFRFADMANDAYLKVLRSHADFLESVAAKVDPTLGRSKREEMVSFRPASAPAPSPSNLYNGISAERQEKIRIDIEKDLRAELTTELTKKIRAQVAKDLEQERAKALAHPEDMAAARAYFKEVELSALAVSTVLAGKRAKSYPRYSFGISITLGVGIPLGIAGILFLLGLPFFAASNVMFAISMIMSMYERHRSFTSQQKYDEFIRDANSIAGTAKAARTIYLNKSFTRKELLSLVEDIRTEQMRLDILYAVTPQELETARVACESQVIEETDDFMTRLRDRRAEEEAMAAEEEMATQRASK